MSLFENFPKDAEGRIIYGDPHKGCQYCGEVAVKYSEDGKLVYYHPAVLCCRASIQAQVNYRKAEIADRQRRIEQHFTDLERLEETMRAYGESKSAAAAEVKVRHERAERGIRAQVAALEEQIKELELELAEATSQHYRMRAA